MAHDVKISLFSGIDPFGTAISNVVDTSTTSYYLESVNLQTPTVDPLTERIVETMVVRVKGSSLADLRTKLAALYYAADIVRQFEMGESDQFVRVQLQVLNTGNIYWSTIHAMHIEITPDLLKIDVAGTETSVTITYERDGYWEASGLVTTITITNPNGSGTLLGIANCNDNSGTAPNKLINYVDIDTSDVDGDLPTPLYIQVNNIENVSTGHKRIYAGGLGAQGTAYLPTTLFFEAESATSVGGSNVSDASCSGGYKKTIPISADGENNLLEWTINDPNYFYGHWYKIIARFDDVSSLGNVKFRWQLRSGTTVVWEGPQFLLENDTDLIQEMGEFPLPIFFNWNGSIVIRLTGQRTTSVTETLNLDYIQLMAAHTAIKAVGLNSLEYSETAYLPFQNSFPHKRAVRYTSSKNLNDWYMEWNRAVYINPGQYYRLHFVIQSETGGTAEIDRNSAIACMYRPRYRAIGE